MHLFFKPSASHAFAIWQEFSDQAPSLAAFSIHLESSPSMPGKSMNKCLVFFTIGTVPLILLRGSTSSEKFSNFPHLSHWSARAPPDLQCGHVPSMKRSAKNMPAF